MEVYVKIDINDEQFSELKTSIDDYIKNYLSKNDNKEFINKLIMQIVSDYINSNEGKELARKSITTSTCYNGRNYNLDIAKFLINEASKDIIKACEIPFIEFFKDILKDKNQINKLLHQVLIINMSHALTQSCQDELNSLSDNIYIDNSKLDSLEYRLNKLIKNN